MRWKSLQLQLLGGDVSSCVAWDPQSFEMLTDYGDPFRGILGDSQQLLLCTTNGDKAQSNRAIHSTEAYK